MYTNFRDFLKKELADIEAAGLYKKERVITTPACRHQGQRRRGSFEFLCQQLFRLVGQHTPD